MSITTALEALEASLTQPETPEAVEVALHGLARQQGMLAAAQYWIKHASQFAAIRDDQEALKCIARARSCIAVTMPR